MVLALVGLTKVKPKQPHKPSVAKDTASSNTYTKLLYGLSEGEIYGLADGAKSIKLDGTPIVNDDGQPNFNNVRWELRTGTLDQSHIAGFPSVENETPINVELRHDRPLVRSYNNPQLSALRVRLSFNGLKQQKENGDIVGYTIEYAFDVATDGGAYREVLRTKISDKVSNNYTRDYRIELPKGKRWSLRVRRITPNQNSDLFADTMNVAAITEIIDAKLRYPCTALLGLEYDAESFQNIAKLAVRAKGVIIQVPSNYNASTRTYTGFWDGTFKREYSNNPAWVFYDLCTNKRYGLGERLAGLVDKWKLYQLGQYCDEMVDDGKGGQEPRFSCNIYIQKLESAYTLLQNIASTFRAMSYWNGEQIVLDADVPKEPVYTFSRANVVGGEFIYTGTRARDRHTVARVAWNNPNNDFEVDYEFVRDENAIAKYGVRMLEINAVGCTSQGQAQRQGMWALKSEQLETQQVTFKTGLMGFIPQVGQVINIADDVFAGRAISGRIVSADATTKQLTLDRQAGKVGDTITLNTAGQVQTAKIVAVNNPVLTLDKAVGQADDVWAIISDDLKLMQFRVMSVKQNDDATFDVQGLQYEKQKFDAVDNGASITLPAYSVSRLESIEPPANVTIVSSSRVEQGVNITVLTINWQQVSNAVAYRVEWQKDDVGWQIIPKVAGLSVDIEGVYSGNYLAKVIAIDAYGNESLPAFSTLTQIAGKTGRPPRLARLSVQGKLFGMDLAWSFNKGSDDTNFTEIQVSPDGRANITTLGTFAYPTNKHEITGLQGNLTQYYRARIVDKLGNTSDWTAWVVGTTSAQADKVLDLISGQISQSHLDQSLRTPIGKILPLEQRLGQQIGKIGSLEGAVAGLNGQLDTLNQSLSATQNNITTTQSELNTTKQQLITTQNTLNTAVANITTERSRINSAIRDITALQTANNAKTQELANLTQTVGSYTSSIRELSVTTDELSQRYNQLKTATNNVTSEINTIKQTQVGQATSIDRINARFDNLVVGGRNYLLNSNFARNLQNWENWGGNHVTRSVDNQTLRLVSNNTERWRGVAQYVRLNKNTSYILSFDAKANVGSQIMLGYHFKANSRIIEQRWHYVPISNVFVRYSVQISILDDDSLTGIYLMIGGQALTNHDIELKNLKLEIGNIATDWTPAPEDVQSQLDSKATIASLDELRQIQATKDQATASQISNLTANVTTAQQTANTANSKANTATTKADNGIRRANNAQNTANTANNKADTANTNAQNAKRTADDALGKANTANSTITAEQRARADADSALSNRITALDSAYKQADNALRASITTAQQTATNAQQAVATAQSQLNARIDGKADSSVVNTLDSKVTAIDNNLAIQSAKITSIKASNDILSSNGSLVADYETNNPDSWISHYQDPLAEKFVKINDGKISSNVVRKFESITRFWNYNKTALSSDRKYRVSMWVRRTSDSKGEIYFTILRLTASQNISKHSGNYTHISVSNQVTLDNNWCLVSAIIDQTQTANTYPIIHIGFALNHSVARGVAEMQGFKVEPIYDINNLENIATTSALQKLDGKVTQIDGRVTSQASQITALDTAYKQADNTIKASVQTEAQARTNADNALSQRIDSLTADYNGNKSSIASQLKTLSDKDKATASQISQITANVTTAQNTANTANTNAQNAKRVADDALGKANTANSAITTEQRARADGDSSLASRIATLDSAYKQADSNLTSRIAREETARASGDNANAQAVRNLESTVNGINGRVGTAESKIGTLERTTANTNQALATAQSQLNARFDNLVVGGRNLLRNSKENHIVGKNHINQSGVDTWILPFAVSPISVLIQNLSSNEIVISYDWQVIGDNVSGVFWAEINAPPYGINNTKFITVNNQNKSGRIVIKSSIDNWRNSHATALKFRLDNFIGMLIIRNAKLEIGNIATDWTPAPEDSNWLIIDQKTDLNSLTETSKYFIRNTQNPNSPVPPHWLFVEVDNGFNDRIKQTVTQDNDVKNQWVRHRLNGHWGAWEKMANASELQNVQATIDNFKLAQATKNTATAQQITTLQTTLNGHTSSIQQHTQSINGLNAQWTLKVESGGIVGGMGLASNNGKSRLALRADIIDIADSRGSKKPMFSVLTKTQTINGVQVPAGVYLNSAYIAKGSIDNAKIGIAEIDTLNIRNQAVSVVASIKENINNIPFVNVGNHNSTKSVYLNSQSGKTLVNLVLFNLSWSASNYSTAPIFIVKLYCNNIEFDSFSLKVTTNQLSVTLNSINTSSPSGIAEYKAIIFADTKYSVLLSGYTLTVTNLKR